MSSLDLISVVSSSAAAYTFLNFAVDVLYYPFAGGFALVLSLNDISVVLSCPHK